jgi:glucose-fructose oxidoreductase
MASNLHHDNGSRRKGSRRAAAPSRDNGRRPLRFGVIGAGHIAQNAVLPAFAHTRGVCELTAIVSGDPKKQRSLARKYGLDHVFGYEVFDEACRSDIFDAVYIALPNSMHREYTERAAAAGLHVLCEKPMATTAADCQAMIDATRGAGVCLMIAYRLHFEAANLQAAHIARSRKIGDVRLFHSVFCLQAREGNIRLDPELGGGPLWDIGIYCINAARYIMGDEPVEVSAIGASGDDPRFREVEEAFGVVLRFPGGRLATFTCSFGAADAGWYQVVGTKGNLLVKPAYEYEEALVHELTVGDRTRRRAFPKRDQFAPELLYFAECVRNGVDPEPGGAEGLIDVRIIEAIRDSARTGNRVMLPQLPRDKEPELSQERRLPPVRKPRLVHSEPGHR